MGYKFGASKNQIIIEIEDKKYPITLSVETAQALETFGQKSIEISKKPDNVDFVELENLLLDFIETMIGVDETAELLESMPAEFKNPFEYMEIARYITEQIREQGEKFTKPAKVANGQAPRRTRTGR